jgi:hypothetical protein
MRSGLHFARNCERLGTADARQSANEGCCRSRPVGVMTSTPGFCGNCGRAAADDAVFCAGCGQPLAYAGASATPPPPPPGYAYGMPPPPTPGYSGAPGYTTAYAGAPVVVVQQTTNGLAVASLVLGIIWVFGLGAILAVIFGFVARRQIRRSDGRQSGEGMALAGIILGFIGVLGVILWIALIAAFGTTFTTYCHNEPGNLNHVTCSEVHTTSGVISAPDWVHAGPATGSNSDFEAHGRLGTGGGGEAWVSGAH